MKATCLCNKEMTAEQQREICAEFNEFLRTSLVAANEKVEAYRDFVEEVRGMDIRDLPSRVPPFEGTHDTVVEINSQWRSRREAALTRLEERLNKKV